jgi:hypothetical protein
MFTFPAAAGDADTVDAGVGVVPVVPVVAGVCGAVALAAGLVEVAAAPEWDSLGRMSQ